MKEYLAEIIDAADEGIYVTDRERRFILWNRAAERISGYGRSDLIGRLCYDNILQHADREGRPLCQSGCPLQAAIEEGEGKGPAVVFLRHKSGRRVAVEVRTSPVRDREGDIIGGVEVFQDVTERLERERLLLERKEKLETVLQGIGDGILFLDTEGNATMINRACARMFAVETDAAGFPREPVADLPAVREAFKAVEDAYRRSLLLAVDWHGERCPEGKGRFRCWTAAIDRSAAAPRSPCYVCATYRMTRAFLEKPRDLAVGERAVTVVSSFLEFPATNDLWEIVVFHDVTAEKFDTALKVAGAAAHELRQPMQVIMIAADMLKKKQRCRRAGGGSIETILKSCERMNGIIRKMSEITQYRTKEYVGDRDILDIDRSSRTS